MLPVKILISDFTHIVANSFFEDFSFLEFAPTAQTACFRDKSGNPKAEKYCWADAILHDGGFYELREHLLIAEGPWPIADHLPVIRFRHAIHDFIDCDHHITGRRVDREKTQLLLERWEIDLRINTNRFKMVRTPERTPAHYSLASFFNAQPLLPVLKR